MQLETKFLLLREPAALGSNIDGWRVYWLGGWDRSHFFYYVMVARVMPAAGLPPALVAFFAKALVCNRTK
jgi:hypothetical protein